MKKTLIGSIFAITFFVVAIGMATTDPETNVHETNVIVSDVTELACKYGQCNAIAKSTNRRCKHCVSKKGDFYCYQHR